MLAGLVPDIARELGVSVGAAGALTSGFAVGMVAGAPLMAGLARRWPRRGALLGFLAVFPSAHVVEASTDGFRVQPLARRHCDRLRGGVPVAGLVGRALVTMAAVRLKGRARHGPSPASWAV
ncbi:hypothetical protein [Streptomyces sp. SID13726]|uniref:hypothetical protein n=1 Tax=Streptomyces sp. SID13726 TaxID=2706058 RepID=UPI001EF36655|nr:hypothetical protein [Streptomyces sp. SID13726]